MNQHGGNQPHQPHQRASAQSSSISAVSVQLAGLVVEQAARHGFDGDPDADAIREAVDQFCTLHNITAAESERIAACIEAERLWSLRPSWSAMCERFGLDESFQYSVAQQEEYYRLLTREAPPAYIGLDLREIEPDARAGHGPTVAPSGTSQLTKVADLTGDALDWAVAVARGAVLENKHDAFRRIAKGAWSDEKLEQQLAAMTNAPVIVNDLHGNFEPIPAFSTSREHGGLIVEEEGIATRRHSKSGVWYAMLSSDLGDTESANWAETTSRGGHRYGVFSYEVRPCRQRFSGDTLLAAAMRCYVASKLGEEIEVPAILLAA